MTASAHLEAIAGIGRASDTGGYRRFAIAHFRGRPIGRGERFVVSQWERMVLLRDGVVTETLGPGAHRRWERGLTGWPVDIRPRVLQVPTQEIPTADGLPVKVSVSAQVTVVDPVAHVTGVQDANEVVYLHVQVALREVVATVSVDELLAERAAVAARVAAGVGDLTATGVAIDRLDLKDVVLPAELKRAHAQVALAKAEGLAAVERARAETAALRGLANAARLAQETPALLELRMLQELGRTTGHTVVLGARP